MHLLGKEKDATCNRGGGAAGLKAEPLSPEEAKKRRSDFRSWRSLEIQDRQGGSVGHSKYKCNICMQSAPDPSLGYTWDVTAMIQISVQLRKSMQMHFESKHPKEESNKRHVCLDVCISWQSCL